jgi:hypothetical protein
MKELGREHADLVRGGHRPCDDDDNDSLLCSHTMVMMMLVTQPQKKKVDVNTINPLKAYHDGELKEIANLKERYDEPPPPSPHSRCECMSSVLSRLHSLSLPWRPGDGGAQVREQALEV